MLDVTRCNNFGGKMIRGFVSPLWWYRMMMFGLVAARDRESNRLDLRGWLRWEMKRMKEVHEDAASKTTPVTLGWALPPVTHPSGNGGAGRGAALAEDWRNSDGGSESERQSKKPQAEGNRNNSGEGWKQRATHSERGWLGVQVYQNMT